VEFFKEAQNFTKTAAMDVMRRVLGALGFGAEALFEPGDGVVGAKSQTMSELPWFQGDKRRLKISRTITLTSVHAEHLKQSTEIQHVSLEDKPEFKGAEFYQTTSGTQARLVIDFVDYLPAGKCSVELSINPERGKVQRYTIPQTDIALVRKKNGSLVDEASFLIPPTTVYDATPGASPSESSSILSSILSGVDWSRPAEITIRIKNSFGNETTTTKTWQPR
jgi:hypothetical protein